MTTIEALSRAWIEAASHLEFSVEAPFEVVADDGHALTCAAYIPDFGGPKGTVVSPGSDPRLRAFAETSGIFYSELNPEVYASYEPETFRETLNDWGWFGEASARPAWYTGKR